METNDLGAMETPRNVKSGPIRPFFGLIHRWVGLFIALFLFVSGVTGAVISWDHELDELLNPQLTEARARGEPRDSFELLKELEKRHPHVQVTYVPLAVENGHSLSFGVEPRIDPKTGRLFESSFNEVFVDPATGHELGKREWGAVWPITRETFVSFLYKLHYSLHLPEMWGRDEWGMWLMGVVALLWTLDCFVGFYLTLPARKTSRSARSLWERWKPSWFVRTKGGSYKFNYDLHRAGGLWTWGLLFVVAFTAFSMNLYSEVFYPLMSKISDVTPTPFDVREPREEHQPIAPQFSFDDIVKRASADARQRGWKQPVGDVYYARGYGIYSVSFYRPEEGHGVGGAGHRRLYLDGQDARLLGESQPWQGTLADIFVQAQFPLHSGRILGIPGRILISLMGLVVAGLSVTGVYLWWHKRRSRRSAFERRSSLRGETARDSPESILPLPS